jgi:hypothetical protein
MCTCNYQGATLEEYVKKCASANMAWNEETCQCDKCPYKPCNYPYSYFDEKLCDCTCRDNGGTIEENIKRCEAQGLTWISVDCECRDCKETTCQYHFYWDKERCTCACKRDGPLEQYQIRCKIIGEWFGIPMMWSDEFCKCVNAPRRKN